jgi:hypothetical protein
MRFAPVRRTYNVDLYCENVLTINRNATKSSVIGCLEMRPEITPPGLFFFREVSKMRVVFLDADDVRVRFEAACSRLGEGDARRAFSMALNKEGRKSFTAMRRALSLQSSIPRGAVNAAMRFKGATRATLSTTTAGTGRHLPLSFFGAKQFSYGVRAKIWGRAQTFRSAFVVNRYGHGAFKRKGKARFPIGQLWGPAVPVEMLRDEAYAAWTDQHPRVLRESERLIALMLTGAGFRGAQRNRSAA